MRKTSFIALLAVASVVLGVAARPSRSQTSASELALQAKLKLVSDLAATCPSGSAESLECPARTGDGPAPGVGAVTEAYSYLVHDGPPLCSAGNEKVLGYPVRWVVANKGEIQFAVAEVPQCIVASDAVENATQSFTVTGGTGMYAGAAGSGTVSRTLALSTTDNAFRGSETWTGMLSVPGLDFDVTAPVFSGAANKTVNAKKGAKRVRVTYNVTARDAVDGGVAVTCSPPSGSKFKVGRTLVKCASSDKSANTGSASFRVTVRPAG